MTLKVGIIGAGIGGLTAALYLSQLGFNVTIFEKDEIGGECINRACIPSKILIEAAKILTKVRNSEWIEGKININHDKLLNYKNFVINSLKERFIYLLKKYNVNIINKEAKVVNSNEVKVGDKILSFDKLVIATGSEPLTVGEFPINGKNILDPYSLLNLDKIPKKLIILGGGIAGIELASLYSILGSEVILVELTSQLLSGFDREISFYIKKILENKGVKVYLNSRSKLLSLSNDRVKLLIYSDYDQVEEVGDLLVVTIGRKPSIKGINLDELKINTDSRGFIKVDEYCKTSNNNIYAVGDVTGVPLSGAKAFRQGLVAASNIAGIKVKMPKSIPISIFSYPEIGIIKQEKDNINCNIKEILLNLDLLPKSKIINNKFSFIKLILDSCNKKIIDAYIISENATELISLLFSFIITNSSIENLINIQFPIPTLSEVITIIGALFHERELY
jgi:dihydrolipoamide dehydrogenase